MIVCLYKFKPSVQGCDKSHFLKTVFHMLLEKQNWCYIVISVSDRLGLSGSYSDKTP